ncbi:MAG: MtrAB system histidine kinase MtrB, partial [Actinomycetes bacterium]
MTSSPFDPLTRTARAVRGRWRGSLQLRVVTSTLALSLLVVVVLGEVLTTRITDGLLDAKLQTSLVESRSGLNQAQALVQASDRTDAGGATRLIDQIVVPLAKGGAGIPRLYDILLLSASAAVPQRGSSLVSESSVPPDLRLAVASGQRQAWTYTEVQYDDERPAVPALVVGAPLEVPGLGAYELYYLFPLTQEQNTLDLVQRALAVAGVVLVLLLGWIAWFVTRQVVDPVRYASTVAQRLSAGMLSERMKVHGDDDLAALARSFNQMADSLQNQISQLEELSRVQRRFVSDVSHELRTPLTTVRMASDVLYETRDEFEPATARAAELLQNQLDRFEALLVDLLEISRFDAGAAVLEPVSVDLRDVVARAVDSAMPLASRRGCTLSVVAPADPCTAEMDTRRIDRVIRNLLVNAIEHSEGRPVDVTVGHDGDAVAVTVRDHGVGLRPGESSLVFNRFWRADPARARSIGGTGLGLSIALEDVRLHAGWLQAWGAPGDGAHFRLTLPRTVQGHMDESPMPLEPDDVNPRVQAALATPYREPRREGVS